MSAPGQQTMLEPGRAVALLGHRVTFTGRLATMSRTQAGVLVERAGGRTCAGMSSRASMLVVGMRGWPLMESGHIPHKLAEAEKLRANGRRIEIVSETRFREILGLEPPPDAGAKALSAQQVCSALGIDARTLQRWEHCGLVRSHDGFYDFRDLISLRTVTGLVARGVSPVVIRSSLDALGAFLPGVDRPLAQLSILVSESGELVAELEEALLTPSGQLHLRFDTPAPREERGIDGGEGADAEDQRPRLSFVRADARDSAAWIEAGLRHEDEGELDKAENAYRRAAALAPNDPVPQFNLGNVLLAGGRLEAAAERFAQAVALDPSHAQAWFNLAHVQDALHDQRSAMKYLRRAIAADPAYADAHFNLADIAERVGDRDAAAAAWDDYLRLDPASEWSVEARRRLQALRRPAWA
jgi:hypothetical protein